MSVHRDNAARVINFNHVAVAAFHAHKSHVTGAGGMHRRADRCGIVHAFVCSNAIQNRVPPHRIKHRADPREFHRRTQERLAQTAAFGSVVAGRTGGARITHCAVYMAVVGELRRKYRSVRQCLAVLSLCLVRDNKLVATAQVEREVDIPAEDFRELRCGGVADTRVFGGLEQ